MLTFMHDENKRVWNADIHARYIMVRYGTVMQYGELKRENHEMLESPQKA